MSDENINIHPIIDNIVEFPMSRRMGQIHAARAYSFISDAVEEYNMPREYKDELIYEVHEIAVEWIEENDPTTEELDAMLSTMMEPQEIIIWTPKEPDNDNQ